MPSIMYMKEMPNLHTHTLISDPFGVLKFCSLSGDVIRGWNLSTWEGRVQNGVRMKHMITLE